MILTSWMTFFEKRSILPAFFVLLLTLMGCSGDFFKSPQPSREQFLKQFLPSLSTNQVSELRFETGSFGREFWGISTIQSNESLTNWIDSIEWSKKYTDKDLIESIYLTRAIFSKDRANKENLLQYSKLISAVYIYQTNDFSRECFVVNDTFIVFSVSGKK
jgi:hypothetical protein